MSNLLAEHFLLYIMSDITRRQVTLINCQESLKMCYTLLSKAAKYMSIITDHFSILFVTI